MNLIFVISAYTRNNALCNISDIIEENTGLLRDIKLAANRLLVHPIHQVILVKQVQQAAVPVQPAVQPQM